VPRLLTRAEAEATLRQALAEERWLSREQLAALPADVDAELAASCVRGRMEHAWKFARSCQCLPPPVVRALLATPRPGKEGLGPSSRAEAALDVVLIFLKEAVPSALPDGELLSRWGEALRALLDLNTTYAWGSRQRRAKLAALAQSGFLGAIQAVASGCRDVPQDFLAVLAADGSEGSVDALLPHFDAALRSQDSRLELLERLRTHAGPAESIQALLAEAEKTLEDREASSPALAFARAAGLGEVSSLSISLFLGSTELTRGRVPAYQLWLHVRSTCANWFAVSLSQVGDDGSSGSTWFGAGEGTRRDELSLGACRPEAFPAWLSHVAERRGIRWDFDGCGLRTSLRGKKRQAFLQWLRA